MRGGRKTKALVARGSWPVEVCPTSNGQRATGPVRLTAFLVLLFLAASAFGAVDGTVTNRTTQKPQPGAAVQLYKLGQAGPEFVAMAKSDAQGRFRIDQNLPPGPHLLMTSYAGVNYNSMLPPGQPTTGLDVAVFESSDKPGTAKVSGHTVLLEPSAGQVNVTESFFFSNPGTVTYHDPANGTLRFEIPKDVEAPRVRVTEPGGMPIQREPDKTKTAGLFKLDFPVKPGETEFDITYTAPLAASGEFSGRVLYPTATRFAVPNGVTMEAEGLKPLGQEPQSQANLYEIAGQTFQVKLSGAGSLRGGGAAAGDQAADDSGPTMSTIIPPGFDDQRTKILVLVLVVLALGFALLYRKGRTA
jgi:hypothetical protein